MKKRIRYSVRPGAFTLFFLSKLFNSFIVIKEFIRLSGLSTTYLIGELVSVVILSVTKSVS